MFRLAFAPCPKLRDLGIRQPLDADELVLALADPDEFVQFRLDRSAVAVLRALDQEHHQEGYDGRACVDDELPGLGEAEKRAADRPDDDRQCAKHECRRLACPPRNGVGEMRKDFFHGTPPAVETPVSTQRQTTVDVPKFEEPDDGIYSINEPLPDISDFDFEEDDDEVATRTDVAALRGDMLKKLEELEALILAARPLHGGVGHNNPPAPIDELPVSAADLDQSLEAIRSLRDQAYADEPDETQVLHGASRFRRIAAALGGWIGGRANAVVDAGLTPVVTASLGAAGYAYGLQLLAALESAANSVLEWFHAVMPMF